jgi:hypothetical protein
MIESRLYPTTTPRVQHFAGDSGKCSRCEKIISRNDIGTDWLGRTVENCPSCGPMLVVVRRGVPVVRAKNTNRVQPPAVAKPCDPCVCGAPILWTRGKLPNGCAACRKKRRYEKNVAYNIEKYAKRRREKQKRNEAKAA